MGLRVLAAGAGAVTGDPDVSLDRYLLGGRDSAGLVALVEHRFAPRVLAAPLHRHHREDEYSFVLEGRLRVIQDSDEIVAEAGDLVFKPRGHWHTFWNAGDRPLRVMEIIVPAGLEQLFRLLGEPGGEYNPETLPALAAQYGGEVDFERTEEIIRRHSLVL